MLYKLFSTIMLYFKISYWAHFVISWYPFSHLLLAIYFSYAIFLLLIVVPAFLFYFPSIILTHFHCQINLNLIQIQSSLLLQLYQRVASSMGLSLQVSLKTFARVLPSFWNCKVWHLLFDRESLPHLANLMASSIPSDLQEFSPSFDDPFLIEQQHDQYKRLYLY